jgi:hypothetical protein
MMTARDVGIFSTIGWAPVTKFQITSLLKEKPDLIVSHEFDALTLVAYSLEWFPMLSVVGSIMMQTTYFYLGIFWTPYSLFGLTRFFRLHLLIRLDLLLSIVRSHFVSNNAICSSTSV